MQVSLSSYLSLDAWLLKGLVVLCTYMLYYVLFAVKKPRLICAPGQWKNFLRSNCESIGERYWPAAWCFNAYLLTLLSNALRESCGKLSFRRELLGTPDGGQISLDWYEPSTADRPTERKLVALFLPGLTGTSQAEYLRLLIPLAYSQGYRPVVLNYRGMANTPLLTSRIYCAARDDDLRVALTHIRTTTAPDTRILATGLSMGGAILANYLGRTGAQSEVDCALLISTCYDFHLGAIQLRSGLLNRLVNRILTKLLVDVVLQNRAWFENTFDLDTIKACRGLRQFDHHFTIKVFDFPTTDHYYTAASSAEKIEQIRVPTLCLQAGDDMIAPEQDLPFEQVERSSHVAMVVTARGGHIGFMEGFAPSRGATFFMERLFRQYCAALAQLTHNPRLLLQ